MFEFPFEDYDSTEPERVRIYQPHVNPPVFSSNLQSEGICNEMSEVRIWNGKNGDSLSM